MIIKKRPNSIRKSDDIKAHSFEKNLPISMPNDRCHTFYMRGLLHIFMCIALCASLAKATDDEVNLQDDASAFSELISQNGGKLPGSFGAVRKLMKDTLPLAIPDGRSLQKKKADFKDPRIIIAKEPRLFIGYAPKANQAEVISWNSQKGEFDFFIIKDFGKGLTPKLTRPDRSVCMSCHQSGGPIFSRGGWDESTIFGPFNGSDGKPFRNEDGTVFQGNDLYQKLVAANNGSPNFDGVDVSRNGGTFSSSFDAGIRDANRMLQSHRACREMCGSNKKCRSELLLAALIHLNPQESVALQQSLEKSWPKDGFAQPSSVIPNRDPLEDSEHGGTATRIYITDPEGVKKFNRTPMTFNVTFSNPDGTKGHRKETSLPNGDPSDKNSMAHQIDEMIARGPKTAKGIEVTYDERSSPGGAGFPIGGCGSNCPEESKLVLFDRFAASDGSAADPLTPRPKVSAIPVEQAAEFALQEAFNCLGFTDFDRNLLASYNADNIKAAISGEKIQSLMNSWPPNRGLIMRTLLTALGAADIPACYQTSGPVSSTLQTQVKKIEGAIQTATPVEKPRTFLFQKYCATCHATDDIAKLPLESIQKMRLYKGDGGSTVLERLKNKEMPPSSAKVKPSDAERHEMIHLLEHGE